jgi:hypothetical protein
MTYTHRIKNGIKIKLTADEITALENKDQIWLASRPSEFDMAMADLRAKRNRLLAESDFVMLEDAPIAEGDKAAWQTYRNRLRNITNGMDDITDIENTEWPTKPGA